MQNRTVRIPQINFTDEAYSVLYDAVDDPYFVDKDADIIYEALRKKLRAVPFCDYLKRFLYKTAELKENFADVPLETYRGILSAAFRENAAPVSFEPVSVNKSTLLKNWLTQKSVRREVVLLLGFGLKMRDDEVNEMLIKALRERSLDPGDPDELICWYCYHNGCPFSEYARLKRIYLECDAPGEIPSSVGGTEAELLRYLIGAKNDKARLSRLADTRAAFNALFARAQTVAAGILPGEIKAADVTEADLEKILCSAVPRDSHGNLSPTHLSRLNALFAGKRPSRQRLNRVRAGSDKPDRFDLITLSFFIASQSAERQREKRYTAFLTETNRLLDECGYGPLYVTNPYECFILMCILSEDPLATYCDVWELSYAAPDVK